MQFIKRTQSLHIINATDNKSLFLKRIKTGLKFFTDDLEKKLLDEVEKKKKEKKEKEKEKNKEKTS